MKRMAMKGKLTEQGLPRTPAIRTGSIDARSHLGAKHGTKRVSQPGFKVRGFKGGR
jgi:hypothetical protein